jgi:hypothetical protein
MLSGGCLRCLTGFACRVLLPLAPGNRSLSGPKLGIGCDFRELTVVTGGRVTVNRALGKGHWGASNLSGGFDKKSFLYRQRR